MPRHRKNAHSKRREDARQALGTGGDSLASCPLDLPSTGLGLRALPEKSAAGGSMGWGWVIMGVGRESRERIVLAQCAWLDTGWPEMTRDVKARG